MDQLLTDLRYAIRTWRRNPGFVIVAIVTLALGIGANSTIFSVVNATLLRPLSFPDADRLMTVWKARIQERIAELERLRNSLTECIGCGCLSLDRCQFANPGDRAARQGTGPRYWMAGNRG